jgi:hypothetical protein
VLCAGVVFRYLQADRDAARQAIPPLQGHITLLEAQVRFDVASALVYKLYSTPCACHCFPKFVTAAVLATALKYPFCGVAMTQATARAVLCAAANVTAIRCKNLIMTEAGKEVPGSPNRV